MIGAAQLKVTWIPRAKSPQWHAGMDLNWPHRALLMWTPLDACGDGIDPRLRDALWRTLDEDDGVLGIPVQTDVRRGLLDRVLGQPGRAVFAMHWQPDSSDFERLLDEQLFFAAVVDPSSGRPDSDSLAFWHDQADPPDHPFFPGLRVVLRSGVDLFCLGVFCHDASALDRFRERLTRAVEAEGGSLAPGDEPTG